MLRLICTRRGFLLARLPRRSDLSCLSACNNEAKIVVVDNYMAGTVKCFITAGRLAGFNTAVKYGLLFRVKPLIYIVDLEIKKCVSSTCLQLTKKQSGVLIPSTQVVKKKQ